MTDSIAKRPDQGLEFTREHIDLIKKTIAPDLTDTELQLFLHVCRSTRLDPLMRQIYVVKRRSEGQERMTFQVGIDGSRLVADRTGFYAGSDDAIFTYAQTDTSEEHPLTATVTVWKLVGGFRCAFTATARWSQYYPGDRLGFMWRKMPHVMIAKCAEALSLRKAFPAELSNLYVKEEMDQAGIEIGDLPSGYVAPVESAGLMAPDPSPLPITEPPPPTDADYIPDVEVVEGRPEESPRTQETITGGQIRFVHVLKKSTFKADTKELTESLMDDYIKMTFRKDSLTKLTKAEARTLIDYMKERQ